MAEYYDKIDANLINTLKYYPQVHSVLKVELLDYLENTIGEITQDIDRSNAGSIENNYQQGVRRTCSITLINTLGDYIPSFNRGIWFHTKFKPYIGFYIGSDIYWFSQGIYILTNPSILNNRSEKTITLNGVDKFGVLGAETSFHELNGTYKIPAGTKIKNAVRDLLKMPIGNVGGQIRTITITGLEYQAAINLNGYIPLKSRFHDAYMRDKTPSALKQIVIVRNGSEISVPLTMCEYDIGTSGLLITATSSTYEILSTDNLKITIYEGYPLDPKEPFIDNRIIEYYDAIEFLGNEMSASANSYILRDDDGFLPTIDYSSTQPFYIVYLNREEVPYNDTSANIYYTYDSSTHKITFRGSGAGTLGQYDNISIVAKLRGTIGDIKIPYDIIKSPNEFYGDLIIELATIVACDVYYDANGYLNFAKGNEKQDMDNLPTVWTFSNKDNYYFDPTIDMDFTNMFNVIKVVGTNSNAKDICEKTVKNMQLNSPVCVQILGEKIKYVESSFCYNQPRTEDFANYLLRKYSRVQQTLGFGTILLPFLDTNQIISITDDYFELDNARFVIQSISTPLNTDGLMQLTTSNVANIPYFEAQGG